MCDKGYNVHRNLQIILKPMNLNRYRSAELLRKPLVLKLFFLRYLPMGFLAGLRLPVLQAERCSVRVRYRWSNKNPFGSIYFAVLAMAAELSTGALVLLHMHSSKRSDIRFIVTEVSATFLKKARGKVTFTCTDHQSIHDALNRVMETDHVGQEKVLLRSSGMDASGDEVARFEFEWVFSRPAVAGK